MASIVVWGMWDRRDRHTLTLRPSLQHWRLNFRSPSLYWQTQQTCRGSGRRILEEIGLSFGLACLNFDEYINWTKSVSRSRKNKGERLKGLSSWLTSTVEQRSSFYCERQTMLWWCSCVLSLYSQREEFKRRRNINLPKLRYRKKNLYNNKLFCFPSESSSGLAYELSLNKWMEKEGK